jgi:hypothetical protein
MAEFSKDTKTLKILSIGQEEALLNSSFIICWTNYWGIRHQMQVHIHGRR